MKRSRFSEEQIIGILKEAQAGTVKATSAKYNISEATFYGWKRKYVEWK
jgi:putative transposase